MALVPFVSRKIIPQGGQKSSETMIGKIMETNDQGVCKSTQNGWSWVQA